MKERLLSKKTIIIILVVIVIVGFAGFKFSINGKNKQFNYAVNTLQNISEDGESGYITINFKSDESSNDSKLQVYEDGTTYFTQDTFTGDVEFTLESICESNVEYVKTNYTQGFEILSTNDCSSRNKNIHQAIGSQYAFSGIKLESLNSNDFKMKNSGKKTILTAKKDKLTKDIFLGNFIQQENAKITSLVITVEDKKVTVDVKLNHPKYKDLTIKFTVTEGKVVELPQFK